MRSSRLLVHLARHAQPAPRPRDPGSEHRCYLGSGHCCSEAEIPTCRLPMDSLVSLGTEPTCALLARLLLGSAHWELREQS